jgi:hypothetical protein
MHVRSSHWHCFNHSSLSILLMLRIACPGFPILFLCCTWSHESSMMFRSCISSPDFFVVFLSFTYSPKLSMVFLSCTTTCGQYSDLRYGLDDWGFIVSFPAEQDVFLVSKSFRMGVRPNHFTIEWLPGAFTLGVNVARAWNWPLTYIYRVGHCLCGSCIATFHELTTSARIQHVP